MNANYAFMMWISTIMKKELRVGTSESSLLMIGVIVGLMIGMVVFGKLMDRMGIVPTFVIFLIGSAVSVYLLELPVQKLSINPFFSFLIILMIIGCFLGSDFSGFGVIISRLYPMDIRVTANAFISNLGSIIGGALMPLVTGIMMDSFSLTGVLLIVSVISIISLVVMMTIPGLKEVKD